MNNIAPVLTMWLLLTACPTFTQVNFTANDTVPSYEGQFHYGVNLGAYYFWTDDQLANIAAGNPELGIEGAGVTALRLSLPENFLDYWGYDIRLDAFQHYQQLGLTDNVVFAGYPAPQHQDSTNYCPDGPSQLFANLYAPIWDDGENGTPVNDSNFYALYIFKMVSQYHSYVKFWEIWNEPDFDFTGDSSRQPGEPGNWWEYDPDPCHYAIHAPVQHYIRMLRISYEVIKHIAPEDYVAIGGIGYPSFLDVVLRNTDNPAGGAVDSLYPLTGGAYFDVLSYHSYPHIDNSLREWSNEIFDFKYFRHSDRCVDGVLRLQSEMRSVLEKYGYDGATHPEKLWIITESNIPRRRFGEYIGSDEAQRNFLIKAAVVCQMNGILQMDVYQLGDIEPPATAINEFFLMGIYTELDSVPQYEQTITQAGIAWRTVSTQLRSKKFDPERTAMLHLPANIRGGAFGDETGQFVYVLWAETSEDLSEKAAAGYSFPAAMGMQTMLQRAWDFSSVAVTTAVSASRVKLTGSPVFLTDNAAEPRGGGPVILLDCDPNPFREKMNVHLTLPEIMTSSLRLYDLQGRLVREFFSNLPLAAGEHHLPLDGTDIPAGMYLLHFTTAGGRQVVRKVVSAGVGK